jgi:PLP dependent protein
MTQAELLASIHTQIARAAKLAGRKASDIALIAVSKTHDAAAIAPLIEAGHRSFGENRVQEAQGKWPELMAQTPGIDLHLIGQLQSNKAEEAVALFGTIHSVDRLALITALAKAQDKLGKRPACFLQVNIGDEAQKGGCPVAEVSALLTQAQAAGIDITGLMAVPPADVEPAPYFALLAKLARDLGLDGLSMGMSSDFETAIMIGATHIRVGSALFGARG